MAPDPIKDEAIVAEIRADLIARVKRECVIHASPTQRLVDSRGRHQAWLFDLRPLLLDAESAMGIARLFWMRMERFWPFQVAAQELAAVPLLGVVLAYGALIGRKTSGVIVRRERKTHGRQRQLEGELSELPVVLLDDLINSGGTAERAVANLREENARVVAIFTVVDFQAAALPARLEALGLEAESLFKLDEFQITFPKPPPRRSQEPLDILWRFRPRRPSFMHVARKAAPSLAGDRVIHASEDGWVHALDLGTGEPAWSFQAAFRPGKGVWSTPLVTDDAIYVGSYDGAVFRLDRSDGRVVWRFDGADWVGSSPALGRDGASIYIGLEHAIHGGSGGIAHLDADTGALVWEHRTPGQVHATPLVLPGGRIACGANDGLFRLLNPQTGQPVWTAWVGADVKAQATLSADGEQLYVGSCDAAVYAIDRLSGEVRWRAEAAGPVFGPPLVVGDAVAATSIDGTVQLFSRHDGARLCSQWVGGKLFGGAVAQGDDILVGSTTGHLSRLDGHTLALATQHQFPERITSEVAVSPGRLLVPTYDGQLFAVVAP